jgi:hypothetical protein
MPQSLDGLLWLLILLGPLILLQRGLHREIQILLLVAFRRDDLVPVFFSLIFLPGVILHELSHYLAALLLQVKTGKFSLLPRVTPDGRLQLGYVETSKVDPLRDSIIGAAPLLSGSALVAYAGLVKLNLDLLWGSSSGMTDLLLHIQQVYQSPDFWLWFYLIIAISSTMVPSRSDRRAWLTLSIFIISLLVIGLLIGVGPWLLENAAPVLDRALQSLNVVLLISSAIHFIMLVPLYSLRKVVVHMLGLRISSEHAPDQKVL